MIVIALAASVAVWFRASQSAAAVPQDRQGPVLLVPGRTADSVFLVDLQRRLFLTGRRALIVSTGTDANGDLRAQAKQVQATAQELIDEGAPSVDVVGFSAGGVVTRLWLSEGGDALVRRVVTISSPNLGASKRQQNNLVTARLCPVTCPQLSPDSDLLKNLPDAGGPAPWTNLWISRDKAVSAPSAHLPGALNVPLHTICPQPRPVPKFRTAHDDVPSDPLAIGIVLKALSITALTAAPTAADCETLRRSGAPDVIPGVAATPAG